MLIWGWTMTLLSVKGVTAAYDEVVALHEVDIDVGESEVVAVLGANGAGKSTLLKCIAGLVPLRVGKIVFGKRDISTFKPNQTVILVEQNAKLALKLVDRGYVLEHGHVSLAGPGAALLATEHVQRIYLGG